MGYSPRDCKELDKTERLSTAQHRLYEGHIEPCHCSYSQRLAAVKGGKFTFTLYYFLLFRSFCLLHVCAKIIF